MIQIFENMTGKLKSTSLFIVFFSLLPFSASSFRPPYSLFGKVINKMNTEKKAVVLSFDDGPNAIYTHEVLKILKEKKIKATFFLLGKNIVGNELLVRQMQVEGHSIGNHSYSHPNFLLVLPSRIKGEIENTQKEIEKIVGQRNDLFRAPYGNYNNPFLMDYLSKNGYTVIGWSVDPSDYKETDPEKIVTEVLKQVTPGAIILLHDGPEGIEKGETFSREATVKALPEIIDNLRKQGYSFLTIPELIMEEKVLGEKTKRGIRLVIPDLIWNLFK